MRRSCGFRLARRHLQPGQSDLLIGANIKIVLAADEIDFLLQRQSLEHGIDARLHVGCWGRCCWQTAEE